MALVDDWQRIERALPSDWLETRLRFTIADLAQRPRAAALLAPLQPLELEAGALTLRVGRDGNAPGGEALRRALARLDREHIEGRLDLIVYQNRPDAVAAAPVPPAHLPESWDAALATLPADWSDLLGEITLASSDYVDRAALHLAPLNPRRMGVSLSFQFRSASRFGYGASPGMVRRCFERCDTDNIRGRVEVLRVLSDTDPVGTQGPVWQIAGRMV
jgi:hypothetical protein